MGEPDSTRNLERDPLLIVSPLIQNEHYNNNNTTYYGNNVGYRFYPMAITPGMHGSMRARPAERLTTNRNTDDK